VLHVTTGLEIGGGEVLLLTLADAARARRQTSIVISLMADGPMRRRFEAAGIVVHDLGMRRAVPSLGGLLRLIGLIRHYRPDVVQGWLYHGLIAATVALYLSGRRHRTRLIHGIYGSSIDFSRYGARLYWAFRTAAWLSRAADAGIYNTVIGARYHREQGYRYRREVVIANGVDTNRFRPRPEIRAVRREQLGIGPDEIVLISIARVDPMKGWDRILAVTERIPGIRLLVLGQGTEAFSPHPSRILLGAREDVPELLAAADVFVLASLFGEGTSVALTEAMAVGLPVVVTDVGDNAVLAAGCGVVVSSDDSDALQQSIAELLADAPRRARFSAVAMRKIADHYALERAVDAYDALYRDVAA
jgi:glycosyltransferase involved in cell wall biosynthesis